MPRNTLNPNITSRDHVQGPSDAPVTVVEYGDYECPYCGEAYGVIKKLQQYFGEQLRFVFRNFPVSQVHLHALDAAQVAEAAGAAGKFWEMHDKLYENQEALEREDLLGYCDELGLDPDVVEGQIENEEFIPRIREDFMSGVRSGVNGTPCFFINGVRHDAGYDFDTMVTAINISLRKNSKLA